MLAFIPSAIEQSMPIFTSQVVGRSGIPKTKPVSTLLVGTWVGDMKLDVERDGDAGRF